MGRSAFFGLFLVLSASAMLLAGQCGKHAPLSRKEGLLV
jgi:hypothetical protein